MLCLGIIAALTLAVPESPYLNGTAAEETVRAVPTLDADGFKVGPKWLKADMRSNVFVYTDAGRARFRVFARVRPEFKYYSPVSKQKGEVVGNVYRRESTVEVLKSKNGPKEKAVGKYISILEKLPDGKCKMTFDVECPDAERVTNSSEFCFAREFLDECVISAEAREHPDPDRWIGATRMTFADANGKVAFAFELDPKEVVAVSVNRKNASVGFAHPHRPRFSVVFDPGETFVPKKAPFLAGGVDFRAESGVNVAEYKSSPNILINPSFESGERYWRTGIEVDVRTIVTNGVAHSGHRCLAPGKNIIRSVGIVLKSETDYVFSAWIRPVSGQGGGRLRAQAGGVRKKDTRLKQLVLDKRKKDGQWERVWGTFRTPADFHECTLTVDAKGMLVDDLQLEEGTEPTEYAGNPFGLELLTDQPSAVYADVKKPQNLRLRVSGPVGAAGKLGIIGTDFFDRQILKKIVDFKIPEAGCEEIQLGPDSQWPLGTFVFAVRLKAGDVDYKDYLRFSKIDARDGTDRLRGLQGTHLYGRNKPDVTRPVYGYERLRDFGIGTLAYSGNANGTAYERLTKEDVANLDRYGIKDRWGGVLWAFNWKKTLNGKPWAWEGQGINAMTNYPPEMLAWVENEVYEMAKAIPWTTFYAIDTEPGGHYQTLRRGDLTSYAKLMLAINRGLVRANPESVFIPYGACNMAAHSGSDQVVAFLKAAQEVEPQTKFREIEIHTYRPLPEHPDVDWDLSYFLKELDKIGYKDMKVKTGEGSYYYPFWRPSSDLYSWSHVSGKDAYSGVPIPTYDLGWGERIGAALTMRESLVYFKYQDRVNANCSWSPQTVDSRAPIAWTAANAALMSLLGNATFVEDIRFAKKCRALVFDDGAGRTVAAVWRGSVRYDHGAGRPTTMLVPGAWCLVPGALEVIDLMGNQVKVEVEGEQRTVNLPLSGFPFYLRVKNEKSSELMKALKGAEVEADETLKALLPEEKKAAATYFRGREPDWTQVPAVTDGSVRWQAAWNERELRVRAESDKTEKLNLLFDGFGNARENFVEEERGYDYDDFVYQLRSLPDGAADCFRVRAPDHQYTGGAGFGFVKDVVESNVTVRVSKNVFEATLPQATLVPLKLEKGAKFGFAVEPEERPAAAGRPYLFYTMEFVRCDS